MSLVTLPKTVRTFARLRVIAQVLSRHGFGHFVDRLQLSRHVPAIPWIRRRPIAEELEVDPLTAIGLRLVKVCEELGPTYIKLGQIASTRPDIIPPQILSALEQLQDRVHPFPAEQARRIFHRNTGTKVENAFREFTDVPFASGSIGQVHRAITHDGQEVVVKIRRPGIEQLIQLDIYVLQWLADRAEALFPELRPYHPKLLIDEFAQTIRRELDFINEASTTARFHEAFQDDPHVKTPQVHWNLTGDSVLTLEFVRGQRLREVLAADPAPRKFDPPALARHLAESFMRQYFELGFFHADPHPGNLYFRPADGITLFDFGMIGKIDDELTGRLVLGIYAAVNKETEVLIEVLADQGSLGRDTDRQLLARELYDLLDKYYGLPLKRINLGTLFCELLEVVRRNDVTLPREFVALLKSLATASGVVLQLDPEFNLVALLQPRLTGLLRDRVAPKRLLRLAGLSAWHLVSILRDAPRLLREILRGIGRGEFQFAIRHENLDHLASEVDRSSNRIAFALLVASITIGSSLLLSMATEATVLGVHVRYLGLFGYALTFIMGVWLLIAILRSGKM